MSEDVGVTLDDLIGHLDEEEEEQHSGAVVGRIEGAHLPVPRRQSVFQDMCQSVPYQRKTEEIRREETVKRQRGLVNRHFLRPVEPTEDLPDNSKAFFGYQVVDERYTSSEIFSVVFKRGGRLLCPLEKLMLVQPHYVEDLDEFAVIFILSSRGVSKISHKTQLPFRIWTISDLYGHELPLFLFGEAFNTCSSSCLEGDIIAVVNPKISFDKTEESEGRNLQLSVSNPAQVQVLGKFPHFGRCKNMNCTRATNRSVSVFCSVHAQEQLMVLSSNRMNINSSGGACFTVNPHEKVGSFEKDPKKQSGPVAKPLPIRVPLASAPALLEALGPTTKLKEMNRTYVDSVVAKKTPESMSAGELKLAQALKLANSSKSIMPLPLPGPTPASSNDPRRRFPLSATALPSTRSNPAGGKQRLGSGLASTAESLKKSSSSIVMGSGALSHGASTTPASVKPPNKAFKVPNYSAMVNPLDRAKAASKGFREAFAAIKPDQ